MVKSFRGAKKSHMHWHAKPTIEKTPKNITIYCGTNDIRKDADPADIINLSKSVSEGSGSIVIISGLVPRKAYLNAKVRYETICYVITGEVVCKLPKAWQYKSQNSLQYMQSTLERQGCVGV